MEKTKRPLLLESLCYLSFIGNSGGFLIYIIAALFFNKVSQLIFSITNLTAMDGISPAYFCIIAFLHLIAFFGVLQIWNLRRVGLIVYIPARLSVLFLPAFWLGWQAFSMTGGVFTGLFILFYITQIRN